MKRHLVRIALGIAVVLLFLAHASGKYEIPFVTTLEGLAYDARLRLTMPVQGDPQGKEDPRIVIVDIDEKSLAKEGHWPWRRNRLGVFVDKLFDDYQVKLVAFDVVFAEQDESSGINVLRKLAAGELKGDSQYQSALASVTPRLEYDRLFADKMRGREVVLGYYFADDRTKAAADNAGVLPEPVLPKGVFQGRSAAL